MDTWLEATAYDAMDFLEVNTLFATEAIELDPNAVKILDAGTGTARIPILMCQKRSQYLITAVDLAQSMLIIGRSNVESAQLTQRIRLERVDTKRMPYPDLEYDMIISNSLVHHLPDPLSFFQEVKRLIKPGGAILIRDLIRPETNEQIEDLLSQFAHNYDSRQQELFRDSLKAALTIAEVQTLLDRVNIPNVTVDRSSALHWTIQRKFKGI